MSRSFPTTLTLLAALAAPAFALPTADAVRGVLAQDTELAAAQARQQAADSAAAVLTASPYEWTANLSAQQRRTQGAANSQEWNAALEHGLRLPGKARLDRQQAELTRQAAALEVAKARQDSARELLERWLGWAQAKERRNLLEQQRILSEANLAGVRQRIRSGDGAMQEETLAVAELAGLAGQQAAAQLAEQLAAASLRSRFPGLALTDAALPPPSAPAGDAETWRQRLLTDNPRLALARLQVQQLQVQAERQARERTPDPTVGVFTASEAHNTDRIIGLSFSVPLAGQRRQQQAAQAQAEASAAELAAQGELRRQESDAALAWLTADNQFRVWRLTADSAQAQAVAAERGQKGFRLGETGVAELLQLRRQALAAADAELTTRASAWQAVLGLEIAGMRGWAAAGRE